MLEEIRPGPPLPRPPGLLVRLLPIVLICWGFVAVYLLQMAIDRAGEKRMREKVVEELAYFPSGKFIREATIEYSDLAADWVWLRATQYYGFHLMTDHKYEWLGHVFGILTTLDPRFIGAYHFGAITLAWDARSPAEAIAFLVNGMKANPMEWQLPFDAAFISYMVSKDYKTAGTLFAIASRLPNAWFVASRWAAVAVAKGGDYETAKQMWLDIYNSTENKALRSLVVRQLRNLNLNRDLDMLQKAADQFREDRDRPAATLGELVGAGYVERIPAEPYRGRYYIDNGVVKTTTPPGERD